MSAAPNDGQIFDGIRTQLAPLNIKLLIPVAALSKA
jgi:hypothetical protein